MVPLLHFADILPLVSDHSIRTSLGEYVQKASRWLLLTIF